MHGTHQAHDRSQLCETGTSLYATALRDGHLCPQLARAAPCLLESTLLRPDVHAADRLIPTPPSLALPRLLSGLEGEIASARVQEEHLLRTFAPLLEAAPGEPGGDLPAVTVLGPQARIEAAIDVAVHDCRAEVLVVQPGQHRQCSLDEGSPREQLMLDAGARMRALYQHTSRHSPQIAAHHESLAGDVQVRTLDEVTELLLIFDRTVAFIPARKDRSLALEIRHPALVEYFVLTFDRLWGLATPLFPLTAPLPATDGATARQRAIAALIAEGETDTRIAERLGMNVRTCRAHIARLSEALGSRSRGQLGYLIARSGILEH